MPIAVAAPAKINLFLHVTGQRADGYHLLESLAAFADIGDRLEIAPAEALTLEVTGPFAAGLSGDDNLVLRAARLLQKSAGITAGVKITLHKHLPVASGIGGGSADAAATLRGLRQLWKLAISDVELAKLALTLGSDVPVCLAARASWMRGVGEILSPVSLSYLNAVLVNPGVAVSTVEVFRKFSGTFAPPVAMPEGFASARALVDFLAGTKNMLEPAAILLAPVIQDALAALRDTVDCRLARMSGSGATCFGLYEDATAAEAAAARIQGAEPKWWCRAARLN